MNLKNRWIFQKLMKKRALENKKGIGYEKFK